ncbi:HD domain-containing phosphohydrolase [Desulfocurvus sp. DL9XJH121]
MPNYRTVFENLPLPAFLFSDRGEMLKSNAAAKRIFTPDATGRVDPALAPWLHDDVTGFLGGGMRTVTLERTVRPAGKRPLYFSVNLSLVRGAQGQPLVIAVCTDITNRSRYQEKITRLAAIIDSADDAMLSMAPDGTVLMANKSAASLYGFTQDELVGGSVLRMVPAGLEEETLETLRRVRQGKTVVRMETVRRRKDGTAFAVSDTYSPIPGKDGVHAVSLVTRDITKRKIAEQALKDSHESQGRILGETVKALSMTLEKRDLYTAGHQHKVALISCALGLKLGLEAGDLDAIQTAGVLHDIGKICIPMAILSKPARLSSVEMGLVLNHPQNGLDIIKNIPFPRPVGAMIHQHHERMDGTGYPSGLRGDDIGLGARIIAVADVLEAMSAHRPYRPALGLQRAMDEFDAHRGARYDPDVCDALSTLVNSGAISMDQGELILA